jgi:hypothetical protein
MNSAEHKNGTKVNILALGTVPRAPKKHLYERKADIYINFCVGAHQNSLNLAPQGAFFSLAD